MSFVDKDLQSIQEARIIVDQARVAQEMLMEYPQKTLTLVADNLIKELEKQGPSFLEKAIEETRYGNVKDETTLLKAVLKQIKQDYLSEDYVGILKRDEGGNLLEIGVPLGITVLLLPAENTVINAIFTIVSCVKTANTCIVVPHPRARQATVQLVRYLERFFQEQGMPKGSLSCLSYLSNEGVAELLQHPETATIIDIGNLDYTETPLKNSKPMMYGGTGSTPVFIEKSANIKQACEKIIMSRSFDHGILASAEQYLITEGVVAQQVKDELIRQGAYFMTSEDEKKLLTIVKPHQTKICSEVIGQSALTLAQRAGFSVPETTKVLVSEQQYIYEENPYADEMKFPILIFYLEPDWLRACEKCIQLLRDKRNGHTLVIHSNNYDVIQEFALRKPVGRMLVNAPATFTSMGVNSNLPASTILGGLTMGRGMTAKNVTPKELTYIRQIGYQTGQELEKLEAENTAINKEELIQLLKALIK